MRSLAAAIALLFITCATAMAGPFDELSNRLDAYEEQVARRPAKATPPAKPRAAARQSAPSRERLVNHIEPVPETSEFVDGGGWEEGFDTHGGVGDCGGCGSCDACGACGWGCSPFGFYARAEYLAWWVRGSNTPPLVTTSPTGTLPGAAGVLPNATVLFGNERINEQGRSGGRFTFGYWFNECQPIAIEDTFLFLGNAGDSYTNSSDGTPIIARPFFNTEQNRQDSVLVAYPGIVTGSIDVSSTSRVWGNEVNLRRAMYLDDCKRIDLLVGWRYFQLNESLNIQENKTSIDPSSPVPVGTQFNILDQFGTKSQFNGGQVGIRAQYFNCRWRLDLAGKLALGGMSQQATIQGSTTVNSEPPSDGGILALPSNSGTHQQTKFAVLPEFATTLNYELGECWNVSLGYTLLVVTNVLRPGDQINTDVDPRQFPPPAAGGPFTAPWFKFNDSDIWLQGISVGLERTF